MAQTAPSAKGALKGHKGQFDFKKLPIMGYSRNTYRDRVDNRNTYTNGVDNNSVRTA